MVPFGGPTTYRQVVDITGVEIDEKEPECVEKERIYGSFHAANHSASKGPDEISHGRGHWVSDCKRKLKVHSNINISYTYICIFVRSPSPQYVANHGDSDS